MYEPIDIHMNGKLIYDIYFENSYNILADIISNIGCADRKVCVVADSNVAGFHLKSVLDVLDAHNIIHIEYVFEAGERNKNTGMIGCIYEKLIEAHFDRNDVMLALGGGVTGDMTGFAAATYLRGIKFIQLPTSLLAMVDSSIGGKTGVDYLGYKNMVGAFHMPAAVITNPLTLESLPDREYISGFAEIIKHALIADDTYFDYLYTHHEAAMQHDYDVITEIIYRSCNIKKAVVEEDPTEKGIRAHLNFGHTAGHAIEKYMNFELLHGECISLGCIVSLYISYKRGNISLDDYNKARELFGLYRLPVSIGKLDNDAVVRITRSDKKADGKMIRFILLRSIGQAYIDTTVTEEEIIEALNVIQEV